MKQYYILFPNQTNGIKLNEILRREGFKVMIAPTPRELSASCGISILIKGEDADAIRMIIEREGIEISGIATVEKS